MYLADPVDAFFLHIQGSGLVVLPDGSRTRVGYAGTNGHVYYAIGRWLIAEGEVAKDEMSLQAIRDWMTRHPARRPAAMNRNPDRTRVGEGQSGSVRVDRGGSRIIKKK